MREVITLRTPGHSFLTDATWPYDQGAPAVHILCIVIVFRQIRASAGLRTRWGTAQNRKAVAARHGFFAGAQLISRANVHFQHIGMGVLPGNGSLHTMVTHTVTALVYQHNQRERVDVFLDGSPGFSLAAVLAASLTVGQNLDDESVAELQQADAREQAFARALHFLSFRPRSTAEICHYLTTRGVTEADADIVVERLARIGYLDDQAFAQAWVASRNRLRPRGAQALRYELQQKGIHPEIIRAVLAELEPAELAYAAARPQAERWRHLDAQTFRRKMSAFLSRRGFAYDAIRVTIDRLRQEVEVGGVDVADLDG
jgi:regulatory protein